MLAPCGFPLVVSRCVCSVVAPSKDWWGALTRENSIPEHTQPGPRRITTTGNYNGVTQQNATTGNHNGTPQWAVATTNRISNGGAASIRYVTHMSHQNNKNACWPIL